MKYKSESASLSQCQSDLVCVFVYANEKVDSVLSEVDAAFSGKMKPFLQTVSAHAAEDGFKGKSGQVFTLATFGNIGARRITFLGLGEKKDFTTANARKAAAALVRRLPGDSFQGDVSFYFRDSESLKPAAKSSAAKAKTKASPPAKSAKSAIPDSEIVQAIVEGIHLASYSFKKYKSSRNGDGRKEKTVNSLAFSGFSITAKNLADACARGESIAESTNFARRLIAEPPCFMTPSRLADEARSVAKEFGLTIKVFDAKEIEKMSMGSFLGVARGAKEPPKFIVISYDVPKSKKKVAIVGKGITFDSGGLSLKPAQSMEHMKYDMSGAAAVIATMRVVGKFKPNFSVMAVVAATENMPGDNALHPGDVITAMNGKTIEVNNTDAEGRLILADALTYAVKHGADQLIDIATLTGAVVTALGRVAAGIMGSDQNLVDQLIESGAKSGEKLWQLPLYDEYQESLKSDIADLKNAGARGEAGTASAAMFLKEFTSGKSWAHLDIAGPGWLDRDREECNKGGTGFGVRTLCRYLIG
ncbi:MAG: leucyl aminopeptidase [Candidatus Melainabacteria bacterium]|jgi:leucyl aminopeptidase|nr:leucyl aminopeptidase [Candidatus Melainabacteria bacterium]